MTFRNSTLYFQMRSWGRRAGINKLIGKLRYFSFKRHTYEKKFSARLFGELRKGDCFWDVGANVGFYLFDASEVVGINGKVVGFEPSRHSFSELERKLKTHQGPSNIILHNEALGDEVGTLEFLDKSGDESVSNCILDGEKKSHP